MNKHKEHLTKGLLNFVKYIRQTTGWRQTQLAQKLGFRDPHVSRILNQTSGYSFEFLFAFCNLFNINFTDLIFYLDIYAKETKNNTETLTAIAYNLVNQIDKE